MNIGNSKKWKDSRYAYEIVGLSFDGTTVFVERSIILGYTKSPKLISRKIRKDGTIKVTDFFIQIKETK